MSKKGRTTRVLDMENTGSFIFVDSVSCATRPYQLSFLFVVYSARRLVGCEWIRVSLLTLCILQQVAVMVAATVLRHPNARLWSTINNSKRQWRGARHPYLPWSFAAFVVTSLYRISLCTSHPGYSTYNCINIGAIVVYSIFDEMQTVYSLNC